MLMWLSAFFVLIGSIITFIAGLGVLRLPDFFMRMHSATKAGVVGPSLLLVGAGFYDPSLATWIKIALAVLFLFMTTPIAAHLLGKAGYLGGAQLWQGTLRNDLTKVLSPSAFLETESSSVDEKQQTDMILGSPATRQDH